MIKPTRAEGTTIRGAWDRLKHVATGAWHAGGSQRLVGLAQEALKAAKADCPEGNGAYRTARNRWLDTVMKGAN